MRFTRKYRYIIALVGIIIILTSGYNLFRGVYAKSPQEAITSYSKLPALRIVKVIEEVEVNDNEILLLFINDNGNVAFGLVENTKLGYKLIHTSGEVEPIYKASPPADLRFSFYNKEEGWVGYGIVHNEDIAKIMVDGQEANIIEREYFRMWYLTGKGYLDDDNVLLLDKSGKEIK